MYMPLSWRDVVFQVEKRRRYKINDCIQELGLMLPESYNS